MTKNLSESGFYSTQITSKPRNIPINVLLVDDQSIIAESIKKMLDNQYDISFFYCNDPSKAIVMAEQVQATVILQDIVMPTINGLHLVKYYRANPATRDIPLIVLSNKEDATVKADAFAIGANDYIVKLPDEIELIARIRYHSNAYIRLLERNDAYTKLEEGQSILNAELAEAAEYAKSLLPSPLAGAPHTSWRFIPSTQLGGDAFGYHWLDDNHFCLYLLDVCGHGVGAALLSITASNVLRSQSLSNTNFLDPQSVLKGLNATFQMEDHNYMFFTIWYGIFHKNTRKLVYASGGHPPAILITGKTQADAKTYLLKTKGLVIGGIAEATYESQEIQIEEYNQLYVFSDGVYELDKSDETILHINEFIKILEQPSEKGVEDVDRIVKFCKSVVGNKPFADDFSIIKAVF